MGFGLIGADNMSDFDATYFQVIGNQRAMATPPDRFSAHHCSWAGIVCMIEKPLDGFAELLCVHVIGVATEGSISPRRIT